MKHFGNRSILVSAFVLVTMITFFMGCAKKTDDTKSTKSRSSKGVSTKFETVDVKRAKEKGCLSCHEGIEDIREPGSAMLMAIQAQGKAVGDPGGCVICHGGTPNAITKKEAHAGVPESLSGGPEDFYPDPGSMWIASKTCGQCHASHVYRLERALMNTEAGKIQGNLHTWGVHEVQNYNVPWGNYAVKDTDGQIPSVGTDEYKAYMKELIAKHPKQFPTELKQIPDVSVDQIEKDPKLAGFTYQRQECQRCHVAVRGREKRGDYRGMGCSACHMLYGNEGYYEGSDPTIDKKQKGHLLTHRLHGTRKSGNGIPVETCNSCHNRGKRIGVTYQGLMEFPYGSPFNEDGKTQPKLHTKKYMFISDDLHHQIDQSKSGNPKGGMLCQDCHTSIDMHGDGNIAGTTLAQVEIECQDCHGTPDKYPWELPIGFGEEFGRDLKKKKPRGLSDSLLPDTYQATVYPKEEGYLKTARGNPFGNVVKKGEEVILHSATGNDFKVPVLKTIKKNNSWKSEDAMVAMSRVESHNEKLECYACHASWVPQCYGCHVKVDYSKGTDGKPLTNIDWVASGSVQDSQGQTAESRLGTGGIRSPGKVSETRSYLRWEDPVLGINGEGRVTPLMPGCQVVFTVIDRQGKTITHNTVAKAPDEAKAAGQKHVPLALDMAPVQPHSAQRKARSCESCHNNPKSMGLGIGGGVFNAKNHKDIVEDLIDQKTGKVIPKNYQVQIPGIKDLNFDWSVIVKDGQQVATVGTHWPLSRALKQGEIDKIMRSGLCMGCHKTMNDTGFWKAVSTSGRLTNEAHTKHMNELIKAYHGKKTKKGVKAKEKEKEKK